MKYTQTWGNIELKHGHIYSLQAKQQIHAHITYSGNPEYPADILGINLKYVDNPQPHDARSEYLPGVVGQERNSK